MLARLPADCFGAVLAFLSLADVALARPGSRLFSRLRRVRPPRHWHSKSSWIDAPAADLNLLWDTFGLHWHGGHEYSCDSDSALFNCADLVSAACEAGWVDKIQWLCETLNYAIDGVHASHFLDAASTAGHLATVQWLTTQQDYGKECDVVYFACVHGRLAIAQWLVERLDITAWMTWRPWMTARGALHVVCREGYRSAAQWLVQHFASELREKKVGGDALCAAARGRQLAVAQWLVAHYELDATDACDTNNQTSAFYYACEYGNLETAQWLVQRFNLTRTDAHVDNSSSPLRAACVEGHLDVVQWLVEYFELTVADVGRTDQHDSMMGYANENRHFDVVTWLAQRFGPAGV